MIRWHRPLLLMSATMAVLAIISLGGLLLDQRTLEGMPIWAKPMKFTVSLAIYGLTWAWLLSLRRRAPRWGWWLGTVLAVASVVEVVVIISQVVRGRRSHFNVSTALDASLYSIMATTIVVLMVANLAAAVLVLLERQADPAATWAIRIGLVISAAGMALAYLMTPPTAAQLADVATTAIGAHSVGVPDGGPGLPLLGWSTTGGDLRIPHFVGMHALQVIPLLALASQWIRSQAVRLRLVFTAGAGYAGLVALVTWQALRGQPLLRPDALTLGATALLAAGVATAALLSLLSRRSPATRATAADTEPAATVTPVAAAQAEPATLEA
ncbi:hypothetical protein [Streptosporangium carneum]|uniref:Uncharacterized protein n=1 Tax=Streptosporangium carneum TaxID=47481 RepID=A0A9W6I4N9_9ACTN|nr:hypothetical protein [Streptosporangium carneum]GLK10895.1 hypothetical protein GCM10017600_43010 [Streptosporangium carneum]